MNKNLDYSYKWYLISFLVYIVWQMHEDIHNLRKEINNNFILQVEILMVNFKNTLNLFAFSRGTKFISLIRWLGWFWFTFWEKHYSWLLQKTLRKFFLTQMNIFCPANLFKGYLKIADPPSPKNKFWSSYTKHW